MERVLGGADKLVYDGGGSVGSGQGIVPYLPLNELTPRRQRRADAAGQPQQQSGATR